MKFDPEFKNAISQLTSQEKDKLILRLLKRDLNLANQLYFELISTDSVQERRSEMEAKVKNAVKRASERYYSPGILLMEARDISGEITEHVKTTKDKYGDASLNLLMLNELLKYNNERIAESKPAKSHTLSTYIIARTFKILIQIKALHEDYLIEFADDLEQLGQQIGNNPVLMHTAIYNGFDVNWLLQANIPDDIVEIHKDLRANGYLK
jgi:hypothetical protein